MGNDFIHEISNNILISDALFLGGHQENLKIKSSIKI